MQCRKKKNYSTVKLSLSEAVSQGQWIHPYISFPPSYIWFNRERRRPQTELRESVQQQCGQVVNTDMKRKSGIANRFDLPGAVQTGWQGRRGSGDLGPFNSLLSRQLPLSCRQHCHLGCEDTNESPALNGALQWSKRQTNRQTNAPGGWSLRKQLRPTNLLTAQFSIES